MDLDGRLLSNLYRSFFAVMSPVVGTVGHLVLVLGDKLLEGSLLLLEGHMLKDPAKHLLHILAKIHLDTTQI